MTELADIPLSPGCQRERSTAVLQSSSCATLAVGGCKCKQSPVRLDQNNASIYLVQHPYLFQPWLSRCHREVQKTSDFLAHSPASIQDCLALYNNNWTASSSKSCLSPSSGRGGSRQGGVEEKGNQQILGRLAVDDTLLHITLHFDTCANPKQATFPRFITISNNPYQTQFPWNSAILKSYIVQKFPKYKQQTIIKY